MVLGPSYKGVPPEKFTIGPEVVGVEESIGSQKDLLMPPLDAAIDFRARAFNSGFDLEAGQWVSTGGVTSCLRLNKYDTVNVKFCDEVIYTLDL